MKKIKSIDGKLLQAILKGAIVFDHKSTESKSFIVIEQKNGTFLRSSTDKLLRYRYILFTSDQNEHFVLSQGFNVNPAQMLRELINIWDQTRKDEQIKKKHFK